MVFWRGGGRGGKRSSLGGEILLVRLLKGTVKNSIDYSQGVAVSAKIFCRLAVFGTPYRVARNFSRFAKKVPAKIFSAGEVSDSGDEDEVEYQYGKESAADKSRDNASSGNVVIADPLPEQSASLGQDVIDK